MNWSHPRHQSLSKIVREQIGDVVDLSHDFQHVVRVYRWALRLAEANGVDTDLAGAAALVHDLVNVPKESPDRPMGSELSAVAGAHVLPKAGYNNGEVQAIVESVRTCSWSRGLKPTHKLGQVLQDADRLDAIGALGIARNFACAQGMASRSGVGQFYHPADPLGKSDRTLDDRAHALDHYPIKLMRLAQSMHTTMAKQEALRRHQFMVSFLNELNHELGSD